MVNHVARYLYSKNHRALAIDLQVVNILFKKSLKKVWITKEYHATFASRLNEADTN
ncbi:MAG: hypothetical protein ACI9Z3_001787 [Roseivirga sp.]|jgi:hypothetical protein